MARWRIAKSLTTHYRDGREKETYAVTPNVTSPAFTEAATATAAHDVLVALFPNQQTGGSYHRKTSLALRHEALLQAIERTWAPALTNRVTNPETTSKLYGHKARHEILEATLAGGLSLHSLRINAPHTG